MPDGARPARALGAAFALLILAGCGAGADKAQQWRAVSLLSGPEVMVRSLRKAHFTHLEILLPDQDVAVAARDGQPLPRQHQQRRLYVKLRAGQVAAAFDPSLSSGAGTGPITIQTADQSVKIFRLIIPSLGISRDYEASRLILSEKYGTLAVVSALPLELYLSRVLPAEMDPEHFTLEALKAQAVVARTWSVMNQSRHRRFGYHFCDGPHCQVYRGRKWISRRAEQAVKMTAGEVLFYKGKLAQGFYHSTCGGNTAYIRDVWGATRLPYLSRVEDGWKAGNRPYCARSPYAHWRVFMSLRQVERGLRNQKKIGPEEKLENVLVDFVNTSGRVEKLLVTTDTRRMHITVDEFRHLFEPEFSERKLLSNFFEIDAQGQQFLIRGKGLGHGVGMCQWGARGMAQHGFSYGEILLHYFQGTRLGRYYGPLFEGDAGANTTTSQIGTK